MWTTRLVRFVWFTQSSYLEYKIAQVIADENGEKRFVCLLSSLYLFCSGLVNVSIWLYFPIFYCTNRTILGVFLILKDYYNKTNWKSHFHSHKSLIWSYIFITIFSYLYDLVWTVILFLHQKNKQYSRRNNKIHVTIGLNKQHQS